MRNKKPKWALSGHDNANQKTALVRSYLTTVALVLLFVLILTSAFLAVADVYLGE